MSLIAKQGGGVSIAPIEAGTHPAVCVSLIDIGEQYNEKFGKSKRQVILQFEVTDEQITVNGEQVNRIISSRPYTLSLNERATLYRDLVAWRGKPFTPEELDGFDVKKIVGIPCFLTITHEDRNGTTYANIASISKAMKGMDIKQTIPSMILDLDEDPLEKVNDLPEWLQKKVKASVTYKERLAGTGNDAGEEYVQAALEDVDDGDELPF